jgi:hypothetical protein
MMDRPVFAGGRAERGGRARVLAAFLLFDSLFGGAALAQTLAAQMPASGGYWLEPPYGANGVLCRAVRQP